MSAMRKLVQLLLVILFSHPFISVMAQEKTVTGTVQGKNNSDPLVGVTVTVKGTPRSTQTDAAGKFSIPAKSTDVLQFSYVGYVSYEARVGESSNLTIS